MSEHRKQPGVAFWAAVVVVVGLVYLVSIGPAFWLCSDDRGRIRDDLAGAVFLTVYRPITLLYARDVPPASNVIGWYLGLWGAP